jgi:hypothetical protein
LESTENPIGTDRAERRHQIFERTVAKYAAAGIPIDQDPEFMALVKLWVSGELKMGQAAEQFDAIRHRRAAGKKPPTPHVEQKRPESQPMTQDELIRQISVLSEKWQLDTDDAPDQTSRRLDERT